MGHPELRPFTGDIVSEDLGVAAENAVLYHDMCVDILSTGMTKELQRYRQEKSGPRYYW
jgi:hypothetical protein